MKFLQGIFFIPLFIAVSVVAQDTDSVNVLEALIGESDEAAVAFVAEPVEVGDVQATEVARDIVLVLDNSSSMRRSDPGFLVKQAITEFLEQQAADTNVGIIVFDQQIRLAVPLQSASPANYERVLAGLNQLNYTGLFRDSPAAIERAVYELRHNGRDNAGKHIIFITDGLIETDNQSTQLERSEWLQYVLVDEAVNAAISISGIALTGSADFDLVSVLADKTGGQAYQIMDAGEFQDVLHRINDQIRFESIVSEPVPIQLADAPIEVVPQSGVVVDNVIPQMPVQGAGQEERVRSIIIVVAAGILVITLGALIILLIKRGRDYRKGLDVSASEAWLNDIHGYTSTPAYRLGKKATMLGRVAGKDAGHLDYVVIPESTIGRRHAVIDYKDYGYWIVDQGSINGTFVNDVRVNGDTRLKHGDKIRLHKFEFEFFMPDLDEAAATRLSGTVVSGSEAGSDADLEEIRANLADEAFELDLDFSGNVSASSGTEDETLLPGYGPESGKARHDGGEETLIPGYDQAANAGNHAARTGDDGDDSDQGDETLIPAQFDESEDDATIRPDGNMSPGRTAHPGDKDN